MPARHDDVSVELPDGADHVTITSTIAAALREHGHDSAAAQFEIEAATSDLATLTRRAGDWVDVAWRWEDPPDDGQSPAGGAFTHAMPGATRWQYAAVDVGGRYGPDRTAAVLGDAGRTGWELVGFDAQGIMLLKRPVPDGVEPMTWSIAVRA